MRPSSPLALAAFALLLSPAAPFSGTAGAAEPTSPPTGAEPTTFTLHQLGPGVYGAVAKPGGPAGSNAGFVVGDDAVAVIDTFQSPVAARELLAEIHKVTDRPVRFVVDTHYHLDHVAGNGVFQEAGAVILAQDNVRAWERTENLKWWGDKVPEKARQMVESLVLPDLTYATGTELYLGKRKLEVRSLPGHTGSDSIVVVADADVVFTGDLFWNHTLPNTTDGSTEAWIATDGRLLAEHPDATFLPGHGEVGKAEDVRAFRGYLTALHDDVAAARAEGRSGDGLIDAVLPRIQKHYGSWAFFDHFARQNITQQAAEQTGTKRLPGQPGQG